MQNLNARAADIELGMTSIYHLIEEFEKNQAKERGVYISILPVLSL